MRATSQTKLGTLVALLALGTDAAAFPHVARPGEGPAMLAERYYGRIELERVLVAVNHLDSGSGGMVVAGMRLEIPAVGYHTVSSGETWARIAEEQLGAASRGEVLARLNAANPWEPPEVGREVVVPFPLRYVASQGDSADSLAYRFLGKRDDAWMILRYNGVDKPRLAQGQVVLIPLVDLPLTDAGKAAARSSVATTRTEAGGAARDHQDAAEREIAVLALKVRHGAYVDAVVVGAGLLAPGDLTEPQLARVYAALTEAYVALGAKSLAANACAGWRKVFPQLELDANHHSPKILDACLGQSASEGAEETPP